MKTSLSDENILLDGIDPDPRRNGIAKGIYSVCSANPYVLEAAMKQAGKDGTRLLIEATSNQVNQFGGYTQMTPADFVAYVRRIAGRMNFSFERILLGGDHLGPNCWKNETSASAMKKAKELIASYVAAGFAKIHLDTGMKCLDDPGDPNEFLEPETAAGRAAELCRVAEEVYSRTRKGEGEGSLFYVIGNEVPTPGGSFQDVDALTLNPATITRVEDLDRILSLTRGRFEANGLRDAWERVVAVVVMPGIFFTNTFINDYDHDKVEPLVAYIQKTPRIVMEAHSTDFQSLSKLRRMVQDRFAVLKTGPALTFAFREAIFALARMETEWLSVKKSIRPSTLPSVVEKVMLENPAHWKKYYIGTEEEEKYFRTYSYFDRIRYYWPNEVVSESVRRLLKNLTEHPVPLPLLSQFLPTQYQAVRNGEIPLQPEALIHHKINEITENYAGACGAGRSHDSTAKKLLL